MFWSKDVLDVNPGGKVTVDYVGTGKHKVLLADEFYLHPHHVSQLALKLCYQEDRALVGGYPGSRAVITLDTMPLAGAMNKLWGEPLRPFHSDYHPIIFSAIIDHNYKPSVW